jgi:hypothetical protein
MTMSLRRRLELLAWATQAQAWIFEDDYDSEYRYTGWPLTALQGLDRDARVIYVGTFSKVLFPALRLAYLVVPAGVVDAFTMLRVVVSRHPPCWNSTCWPRFSLKGTSLGIFGTCAPSMPTDSRRWSTQRSANSAACCTCHRQTLACTWWAGCRRG